MNDRVMGSAHIRDQIPGFWTREAFDWVAAHSEKRQRAGQLVPGPFELQHRLEVAVPAHGDGDVPENRQSAWRSTRKGPAQPVQAIDHLRDALLVEAVAAQHLRQSLLR